MPVRSLPGRPPYGQTVLPSPVRYLPDPVPFGIFVPGVSPANACGSTAQTALPWPSMGLHPHTLLSASTICRPRPLSPIQSVWRGVGASSLASMTASMISPARRSRQSRSTAPPAAGLAVPALPAGPASARPVPPRAPAARAGSAVPARPASRAAPASPAEPASRAEPVSPAEPREPAGSGCPASSYPAPFRWPVQTARALARGSPFAPRSRMALPRQPWPVVPRVPCWTALTTSSPMIVSASSASPPNPHDTRISRVKCRAVLADSGWAARTREVTAGVSHHADGTGSSRGEDGPGSDPADPLTAKSSLLVPETARAGGRGWRPSDVIAGAGACPWQSMGSRHLYAA